MAFILHQYLTAGPFNDQELLLIQAICARLFKLHRSAAQSKRILEYFHVSKSGGTSICQLGQVNGCATESFALKQNCMITYFRDVPRWTVAGALGNLSRASGDPWCAKHGRHGSQKWDCFTRRTLMNKFRCAVAILLPGEREVGGQARASLGMQCVCARMRVHLCVR